ncbi:glycoside hydrolase family 79 protein [Pholiota molesta]|nr:glycoside hydrolase family 79 protein [Pholiota molesta]
MARLGALTPGAVDLAQGGSSAMPTASGIALSTQVPPGASIMQTGRFFGFLIEMMVVNHVGQHVKASGTGTAAAANYTGSAAYNPTVLQPPAPPVVHELAQHPARTARRVGDAYSVRYRTEPQVPPGASIMQTGLFFGFSIEMSVSIKSFLQVPFLNLMANIQQRTGAVVHPDGRILEKDLNGISNPTQTPPLIFTPELLYMLRNISSLVNRGQQILGDFLMGLQVGNEPDLYVDHGHRPSFGDLITAIQNDGNIPNKNLLIGPNVNSGTWTPEMRQLAYLAVEHYPTDNCYAQFNIGVPRDPQTTFPTFLNHTAGQALIAPYLNSTAYAQSKGKRLLMFETNTASCGGFAGISDGFGAALWALDYAMQMAYANFSGAYFHVGGQNVYYNPFTPPPTNQSTFRQWTVGPIYYAALVMAEAIGPSNATQVLDLQASAGNIFTPAYGVYEHGALARVLLFNYASDPSGASDLTVALTAASAARPRVRAGEVLLAASVAQKGNYTWAGQTFGGTFASDGRPAGAEAVDTVQCDPPRAARAGAASRTFGTTAVTRTRNTATVDPGVLATSNGHTGMEGVLGSTSEGSVSAAAAGRLRGVGGWLWVGLVGAVVGWVVGC